MSLSPSLSGDDVEVEEEEEDEGVDGYRKGGYHAVRPGDQFAAGRYVAQRKLGWGNFSTVWLAFDVQSQKYVALKIQKSAPEFAQAALHEIEFLSEITKRDPSNCKCIIQLIDHFKHTGPNGQHICLVFEFLGDSLLKLVQYNRYKGIGFDRVKRICKSILVGLDYLHSELGIIHSDLKLENVLLVSTIDPSKDPIRSGLKPNLERPEGNPNNGEVGLNPIEKKLKMRARRVLAKLAEKRKSVVESSRSERSLDGIDLTCKIVDFGNACWADKQFTDFIQTRQYRAPEIILGAGYSFSVDMWSFACIAFELATGEMLFVPKEGHGYSEDEDHLALMMELLGKMPKKIATMGTRSKEYFDRHGDLKRIRRLKMSSIERILVDKYKISESDAREFAKFLCPLLDFAPEKRPTAAECLKHPWLQCKEDKNCGSVNNNDAKNIDLAQSTGTSRNCTNIDATCKKGSISGSCDKTADAKYNTSSSTNNASINADVQPNIGSIANRLAKNADVNLNIGSITNRDAKNSDTKPNVGSIANSDTKSSSVKLDTGNITNRNSKTIDTKTNTGSISSSDGKSSNVDTTTSSVVNREKRSIRSVVNSYIKNFDAKCNAGSTARSDARSSDMKPSTRSVAIADDAKCVDVKPISGSVKSNDVTNANVKSNTGIVANSDAQNTDVQTNTGSVVSSEDNSVDTKPNIGRVAASIQRLESSMSKVQIGRYR
ncbi:serine/threonine-protein kinase SRPK-like [Panicum miliaceum]|uniref:non-specific serine/threonine protein kinase n=1 Tax=Panicum miliaceum TaxID=4540 RepID=A0A3L6QWL4_PANMI|nr:serine/threonine-protein kinase SRPK-like [Panicum miliaceum]